MVSVLRTLQAEWNELVPQARELRVPRVRLLNAPLETIEYRRTKLEWLRAEIARLQGSSSISSAADHDLSTLTFGVEIEFVTTQHGPYDIARRITAAGAPCEAEMYNHSLRTHWKIVTDNSLGANGLEVVSPILQGQSGFDQLNKVCRTLRAMGCRVTKRCGFHVHIGARGRPVEWFKNLVRLYASAQGVIDSFMAPSRRGSANGYCQPIAYNQVRLTQATTLDDVALAMGQSPSTGNVRGDRRYKKLNLMSYWQHGTVEFRHHQGTVEADKTANWVRMCMRMCLAAAEGKQSAETFDALFEETKATTAEKEFFAERSRFFANREAESVERRVMGRFSR